MFPQLREKLFHNAGYFYTRLQRQLQGFPKDVLSLPPRSFERSTTDLISPIIPVYTSRVMSLQNFLRDRGYPAQGIPYPMVPKGKERLRIVMHSGNSEKDLDQFVSYLMEWAENEIRETMPKIEQMDVMEARL